MAERDEGERVTIISASAVLPPRKDDKESSGEDFVVNTFPAGKTTRDETLTRAENGGGEWEGNHNICVRGTPTAEGGKEVAVKTSSTRSVQRAK